ncbi:MAG: hypothetical protein DLM57_18500 [Pseudonocardiales bacterium]|nr:MAG: hypothetical protein DLM57_18500 [Pseudonocardiales bacterium]
MPRAQPAAALTSVGNDLLITQHVDQFSHRAPQRFTAEQSNRGGRPREHRHIDGGRLENAQRCALP